MRNVQKNAYLDFSAEGNQHLELIAKQQYPKNKVCATTISGTNLEQNAKYC